MSHRYNWLDSRRWKDDKTSPTYLSSLPISLSAHWCFSTGSRTMCFYWPQRLTVLKSIVGTPRGTIAGPNDLNYL